MSRKPGIAREWFTAAQAAKKNSNRRNSRATKFTAAQAAKKNSNRRNSRATKFTAAQAAKKSLSLAIAD